MPFNKQEQKKLSKLYNLKIDRVTEHGEHHWYELGEYDITPVLGEVTEMTVRPSVRGWHLGKRWATENITFHKTLTEAKGWAMFLAIQDMKK